MDLQGASAGLIEVQLRGSLPRLSWRQESRSSPGPRRPMLHSPGGDDGRRRRSRRRPTFCEAHGFRHRNLGQCSKRALEAGRKRARQREDPDDLRANALAVALGAGVGLTSVLLVRAIAAARAARPRLRGVDARAKPVAPTRIRRIRRQSVRIRMRGRPSSGRGFRIFRTTTFRPGIPGGVFRP